MASGTVRAPGTKMPTQQVVVIQPANVDYRGKLNVDPPPTIPATGSQG